MKRTKFKMRIAAAALAVLMTAQAAAPAVGLEPLFAITAYAENIAARVNSDSLNVRSGPGTTYSKVAMLSVNTAVTIVGEATGADGYKWYQINYGSGTGYARYDFISTQQTYAIQSADFENYMNQQGFPESYKNGLRGLHQKYPNWVFKADQTGLDWNTVVSEESKIGRNLVANSSISSWKSLQTGAFDWAGNFWPGFDGANWVQASQELIAHYLDPRNFLTDPYIFQFELQNYDSSVQTKDGLKTLLKDTFLDNYAVVPVEGSVIEGGEIIPGSTYTKGTYTGYTTSNQSSSGSASGPSGSGSSSGIGPGAGTGSNVIIGVGVTPGSGSSNTISTSGPYKIGAVLDRLTGVITSYAGAWKHEGERGSYTWYYLDDNGNRYVNGWKWIDGNNDGIAECYYFDANGLMAANTVVDGYAVNEDGKWISEDGTIQTQKVEVSQNVPTGQLKKVSYADIIMYAAQKSGISPYVIAATILQEQGKGTSDLVSGKSSNYPGYYNFFNTGAYEHDGMNAVTAGLKYAAENGWSSIEKSIIGGAVQYAVNYVNQGQNTYYLKKFNVQGSNKFNHQYMTHVLAAASEGAKVSNAYSAAFKNSAIVFKIPVFQNMPENACALPAGDGNPNNKLSGISVDGYTLTPTFSMDTKEYSLIVNGSSSVINVNARTIDSHASVSGAGQVGLNIGLNDITLTVRAQNGSERQYILHVTRREDESVAMSTGNYPTPGTVVSGGGPEQIIDNSANGAAGPGGPGAAVIINNGAASSGSSTVIIGQGPQ